jgi:two-component system response regulator RstA
MHDPPHLLIIEDDDELAALLLEYLGQHPFRLSRASSGTEGIDAIDALQPDLVILDLMLPGKNGLDVCREVRARFTGSILMLTASQSEVDHVTGLELGADDFVNKPIEPRVLLARIRTRLRRAAGVQPAPEAPDDQVLTAGSVTVDRTTRDATIGGDPVPLTTMEFDVLHMLVANAGSVVTRDDLYTQVLGIEYDGIDRGMDVHVSRIRKKLVQSGFDASRLKSVRGAGYLLAPR